MQSSPITVFSVRSSFTPIHGPLVFGRFSPVHQPIPTDEPAPFVPPIKSPSRSPLDFSPPFQTPSQSPLEDDRARIKPVTICYSPLTPESPSVLPCFTPASPSKVSRSPPPLTLSQPAILPTDPSNAGKPVRTTSLSVKKTVQVGKGETRRFVAKKSRQASDSPPLLRTSSAPSRIEPNPRASPSSAFLMCKEKFVDMVFEPTPLSRDA